MRTIVALLLVALLPAAAFAEEPFSKVVGAVSVGAVAKTPQLQVPYITWGGDMATFFANGGLATQQGTIFAKQGLNLKLVAGDDFVQQVRDYLSGKSPFLRGTFHMIGLASEVIGADPRTKGVVIVQMTWSAGDHMIVREGITDIKQLKGKKIALQAGGPHVGMLDDILKTAQLTWDDVEVVWARDLTASPNSPAEMFKKDARITACFGITPDMVGLCGGLENTGTGAEGTVKGARVLVSTAQLSRSIADVYVCRKDYYDANKELVTKFVAGYLKACEEVIELKKKYEASGSEDYKKLLALTQTIYGTQTIPTPEEAHGLLCDCTFVGYPGNVAFFNEQGNLHGFEAFQTSALTLAVSRGYAKVKAGLFPSGLDYGSAAFVGYLAKTETAKSGRFRAEAVVEEIEELSSGGSLDAKTITAFTIAFDPNEMNFNALQYGVEYQRVVEMADRYGNAVIVIRGHSDPTKTLRDLVKAGLAKGVIKESGSGKDRKYFIKGKPLDLASTKDVVQLIEAGEFDGVAEFNPRETMQSALNLSKSRADAVRKSIVGFAKEKGLQLDLTQVTSVGVGIKEPLIAKPSSMEEAKQNMRVEFRLVRVPAEVMTKSDFDF